ncbi:acetylxylan esterase [Paenibacillus sp. 32352]|uniref:acetylxylan esterase n=1 Tax=Paenibacillus sp. 32352 TaxID=1969111 RepID=UPI0009AE4248|nr:acetylxylan esterase [Paenibacillus sp. 32352]
MSFLERKISDLHAYNPELTAPDDLDLFWSRTLHQAASQGTIPCERRHTLTSMRGVDAYRVSFQGYDLTPITGWYLVPTLWNEGRYPCVIHFHGYAGNSGLPESYAPWLLAGIAVFAIDLRGQSGGTGDLLPQAGGMTKGWITKGIEDKDTCYYKALVADCLRAVDWAAEQPETDPARIGVAGVSQGGGLAMIVSALSRKPSFAIADIPNMCHMDWGIFHSTGSLTEAADYVSRYPERLKRVMRTLSYFDNMNLAERIDIPILVSVSLKDTVCMPETVFAAYNRIRSEKQLHIYPFRGHSTWEKHLRKVLEFALTKVGKLPNNTTQEES